MAHRGVGWRREALTHAAGLEERDGVLRWTIEATPQPELAWVPAGIWTLFAFVAVGGAVLLDGRIAEPLRLAPAMAMGVAAVPIGALITALRSPARVQIIATSEALEFRVTGRAWAAHRAAETWRPPRDLVWRDGRLTVPWTHPSFAKLRAPQAAHFLDGQLRFGRAMRIEIWADPAEGLRFLTRCRVLCLRRLGEGPGIDREIARLVNTDGERAPKTPDART